MPPKGKGCGKSTRGRGRKPSPRKNPKVAQPVSSSSPLQPGEEAPKEGGQHSPTVNSPSRPVSPVDNQSSSSSGSDKEEPLKPELSKASQPNHQTSQPKQEQRRGTASSKIPKLRMRLSSGSGTPHAFGT